MLIHQLPPLTSDRFWDQPLKVVLATLLICLLAPIEFNADGDIPITLQSLLVLLVPMILGARLGTLSVLFYLILGFLNLPVFAQGSSGIDKLWGPTGGFLVGFVLAAFLVGKMAEGKWGRKWLNIALTLLAGHQVILITGFLWLGIKTQFEGLLTKVYPLLPGMFVKILIGTLIMAGINAAILFLLRNRQEFDH